MQYLLTQEEYDKLANSRLIEAEAYLKARKEELVKLLNDWQIKYQVRPVQFRNFEYGNFEHVIDDLQKIINKHTDSLK